MLQKLKNKKVFLVVVFFSFILLVSAVALIVVRTIINTPPSDEKVVLKIDDKEVTRGVYKKLIKQAEDSFVDEAEAKEVIIRASKARIIADEAGIIIEPYVLNQTAIVKYDKGYEALNEWQQSDILLGVVVDTAYFMQVGGYRGYQFNVPFSINYGMYADDPQKSPTEIEAARAAAEKYADDIRTVMLEQPSSANTILQKLNEDEPYSIGYGFSLNLSQEFMMDEQGNVYNAGEGPEVYQEQDEQAIGIIKSLGNSGVSDVTLESANLTSEATKKDSPYFGKVLPIAYRVFTVSERIAGQPGIYDDLMEEFDSIDYEETE